ncbi:MAG: WG repeat-containing protein [Bacteroidaceae bacterium]|nr:WG repeat-containing protein [Bacteroidaceae bacterium]
MKRKSFNTGCALLLAGLLTLPTGMACTRNKNLSTTETETVPVQTAVSADEMKALAEALPQYELVYGFHEGLACVMRDGKYGFIDKTGNEVIPCQYVSIIHDFQEGLACMGIGDEQCVFIDRQGNVAFEVDKKYSFGEEGFCCGRLAVWKPVSAEAYHRAWEAGEGLVGTLGFLGTTGQLVIPLQYDVRFSDMGSDYHGFHNDVCLVYKDGTEFYIDKNGNKVDYNARFDDYSEGLCWAEKDGKWGFIDKEGNVVVPYEYDTQTLLDGMESLESSFHEGLAWVCKGDMFGYIDKEGNVVVPFRYKIGYNEEMGWTDMQPTYDFHEGLARVWDYQTEKFGFIDKTGNEVFPCEFDEADDVSDGLALVKKGDQYGFIDTKGNSTFDF